MSCSKERVTHNIDEDAYQSAAVVTEDAINQFMIPNVCPCNILLHNRIATSGSHMMMYIIDGYMWYIIS